MYAFIIIAAIVLLVFLLWLLAAWPGKTKKDFSAFEGQVFAHRGLHGFTGLPENSLAAFRAAARKGFGAELDVHISKDGRLVVMHDESLLRTAGKDASICDLTGEELALYRLEDSEEPIPYLKEVLPIFENRSPLIIELKTCGKNAVELCSAFMKAMDGYHGSWCMESFDPRAVKWFRENRPEIIRGQLSMHFRRNGPGPLTGYLLTHLLSNFLTRPDFVAYNYRDRDVLSFRVATGAFGARKAYWTLRRREDFDCAVAEGAMPIFEGFDPSDSDGGKSANGRT